MVLSKKSSPPSIRAGWSFDSGPLGIEMAFLTRCWLIVFLLATGTIPVGCTVVRITLNTPLSGEDVAFIVPGQTTLTDVVYHLGAPDALAHSTSGYISIYSYLDLKSSRINLGWLARPSSPVDPDFIISRTGLGSDALEVFYDANGVVTQHGFLRHLSPRFTPYPF